MSTRKEREALDYFEKNLPKLVDAGMPLHLMVFYANNTDLLGELLADPGPDDTGRFFAAAQARCYEQLELEAEALFAHYEPIDRFWVCAVAGLYQLYTVFPLACQLKSGEIVENAFMQHIAKSDPNAAAICMPVMRATLRWLAAEGFVRGKMESDRSSMVLMHKARMTAAGLSLIASPFLEPLDLHHSLADYFRAMNRGREPDPTPEFMEKFYRALGGLLARQTLH